MKINELKINGFGNIEKKQIKLKDNINIIYGKNESGKSTLLKFILNMFYGTSKNKKGRDISDYDKFKPWKDIEFSGKIIYELDNKEKYEVFREFKKRNPKIYNELGEDISKNFNIDKNKGNEFFYEHTKIDENLFLSSTAVMQQEVQLDKENQNIVIQKIANLAGSGDSNISFKRCIDKLNKKIIEEVGTERSQGRPINIIKEKMDYIKTKKQTLEQYKDYKYEIEENKQKIEKEIIEEENKLNLIKKLKEIFEKEKIEKEKININNGIKLNYEEKIEKLNLKINEINNLLENKKSNKKLNLIKKINNKRYITIFIFLILINIISFLFIKNNIINYILLLTIPAFLIFYLIKINEYKNKIKMQENIFNEEIKKIKKEEENIKNEIQIIENNKKEKINEIKKINEELNLKINLEKEKIKNEFLNKIDLLKINEYLNNNNLNFELESIQNNLNNKKLNLHSLELDKQNIIPKLEDLASMEEELELLKEEYKDIDVKSKSINLAKEVIEKSYEKMKENVTPRFTQILSDTIKKISNDKYKKVKFNSENGLIVELDNGNYIPAEMLSTGTIDQLYLSLRLAVIKEISEEKIPIILDESFAYYDDERLENILKYFSENVDNQILILTCTLREKEILEKNNISFNYIEI